MAHIPSQKNDPWAVTVRDINLNEIESAATYLRLRMDLRFNDIGEWSLRMMNNSPAVAHLLEPGSGIVVRPLGSPNVVLSGWTKEIFLTESRDSEIGFLTAVGFTDNILFADLAYIDPSNDVGTFSSETFAVTHDVESGPAETALKNFVASNIGPAAGIARRRYSFLNIPSSAGLGTSGTWRARFTPLINLCQEIATYGEIGFRIVQSAPGEVTLEVKQPEQREDVRFSVTAHNLTSAVLIYRSQDSTEAIVGMEGEGTARSFLRREQPPGSENWGHRIGKFLDRGSIDDDAEARQEADTLLLEDADTAGMQLYPIEQPGTLYGVDYELGDVVSAVVGGVEVAKPVRRVVIEHEAGRAADIVPSVGLPTGDGESSEDAPLIRDILNNLGSSVRR
jgi:hypothetical protein